MIYYIYKVTKRDTNEFYIGKRKTGICDDPGLDLYMGSGNWIKKCKRKYKEQFCNLFEKTIVEICKDDEHLSEREMHHVSLYFGIDVLNKNMKCGGIGGFVSMYGSDNPRYNHSKYMWYNPDDDVLCISTIYDMSKLYKLSDNDMYAIVAGKQKSVSGWYCNVNGNDVEFFKSDSKMKRTNEVNRFRKYEWVNVSTGQIEYMMQSELIHKYQLNQSCVNAVANGRQKSTGGWILINKVSGINAD